MEVRTEVLQRTVNQKNAEIEKYQTKLRDLVSAYKELQKEKAALEITLKALNSQQQHQQQGLPRVPSTAGSLDGARAPPVTRPGDPSGAVEDSADSDHKDNDSASTAEHEAQSDDLDVSGKEGSERGVEGRGEEGAGCSSEVLRAQLATVTQSLTTLMQVKANLEANYTADKRKLKLEMDERERRFEEERFEYQRQLKTLKAENEQWRSKVRSQQQVQERETDEQALRMKELQQLLVSERMAREQLDTQLEELQSAQGDQDQVKVQQLQLAEQTIKGLKGEVGGLQAQLRVARDKASEPSSLLMHLQKELIDVKDNERRVVLAEQQRALEAEERAGAVSQTSERRIAELETRLSELSDMLGGAERLRGEDQRAIARLRERVHQLDTENRALTEIPQSSAALVGGTDEQLDLVTIVEQLRRLVEQFHSANQRANQPTSLIDVLELGEGGEHPLEGPGGVADLHAKCAEQYAQLHDSFEKYKLRAEAALRSKKAGSKEVGGSSDREVATLTASLADLRERLVTAHATNEDQSARLKEKEAGFARAIGALKDTQRAELASQAMEHRQKLAELEAEMRRHRERTVALLAEKDSEISSLRLTSFSSTNPHIVAARYPAPAGAEYASLPLPASDDDASGAAASGSLDDEDGVSDGLSSTAAVRELLSRRGNGNDAGLLHFAQELGRRDVEIGALQRQKRALEASLREAQQTGAMRAQQWTEQCDRLAEQVRKETRDRSRENANLEYLKNVVFRYMTCVDSRGRVQIANAIATILEFSPAEKREVQVGLSKGWWPVTKL